MKDRIGQNNGGLRRRLEALEERVDALEGRSPSVDASPKPVAGEERIAPQEMWAVEVLRRRSGHPFETEEARGSILYAGSVFTPGSGKVAWQIERPLPGVLAFDWAGVAHLLSALAHPVRLEIVRRLLGGARTSQDLQGIDEEGTTGRLYHHLRDLLASGVIVSPRRNSYAIPPQKVVPCLIVVAAAAELSTGGAADGGTAPPGGVEESGNDEE